MAPGKAAHDFGLAPRPQGHRNVGGLGLGDFLHQGGAFHQQIMETIVDAVDVAADTVKVG